jgi:glycerophosphoryl diester phosphodiesterase
MAATPTPASAPNVTPTPTAVPVATKRPAPTPTPAPSPAHNLPRYIAHAGGSYLGKTYSNSIAALDRSYQAGYRLFEVDLNLTTDNEIVLLHDWGPTLTYIHGIPAGQRDLATFLAETSGSPHQVATISDLAQWAMTHPSARIILDTKAGTVALLTTVANTYPSLRSNFIPFIYGFSQYSSVNSLGYPNISLLTYNGQYSAADLLSQTRSHRLHSIAMPHTTLTSQSAELMRTVPVYVYTINDWAVRDQVIGMGAHGVVTDLLGP